MFNRMKLLFNRSCVSDQSCLLSSC